MSYYEFYSLILQGFILVAGCLTVFVYFRQLRTMENQLQNMEGQLRNSQELSLRTQHIDLIKLSISNENISKVWRAHHGHGDMTYDEFQCHVFVNIALSQLQMLFELGSLSDNQLKTHLYEGFKNQYYRAFWDKAKDHRKAVLTDKAGKAKQFHDLCEEAYKSGIKET